MMDETGKTWPTPEPPSPTAGLGERTAPPAVAAAKEPEPFAQAGSQIAELMRRFIDEVGALRRDAQADAESARAAHADAERTRQEAIKLRADVDAEAIRIIEAARAEANVIREEAETRTSDADRVAREIFEDIQQAQEKLAEAVEGFGQPPASG